MMMMMMSSLRTRFGQSSDYLGRKTVHTSKWNKQNSFKSVLKRFCFSFLSMCGQFKNAYLFYKLPNSIEVSFHTHIPVLTMVTTGITLTPILQSIGEAQRTVFRRP